MPAKLAASLIRPELPEYTIGTMPVGSEFYFSGTAMLVDQDRTCYLDPDKKAGASEFLAVRRDDRGYHVKVRMSGIQWIPEPLSPQRKAKLIPVESLTTPDPLRL